MSESKHTPGPWKQTDEEIPWTEGDAEIAVEYGESFGPTAILSPIIGGPEGDNWIVGFVKCDNESAGANARLIAAAPELLEALQRAAELVKVARNHFPKSIKNSDRFQLDNTCATISRAIDKATS
jgi:hypothetical protein